MSSGTLAMIGIFVGVFAGAAGAPTGRGGRYAVLAGAIVFALLRLSELLAAGAGSTAPLSMKLVAASVVALQGALEGVVWCGLWGLLGRRLGRRSEQAPE